MTDRVDELMQAIHAYAETWHTFTSMVDRGGSSGWRDLATKQQTQFEALRTDLTALAAEGERMRGDVRLLVDYFGEDDDARIWGYPVAPPSTKTIMAYRRLVASLVPAPPAATSEEGTR